MKNPEITENTVWKYNGSGGGVGLRHRVTQATPEEIITWSDPVENDPGIGGYSWLGSPDQFIAEFVQV